MALFCRELLNPFQNFSFDHEVNIAIPTPPYKILLNRQWRVENLPFGLIGFELAKKILETHTAPDLRRPKSEEAERRVGLLRIGEAGQITGQGVGLQRHPHGRGQVGAGFGHHCLTRGAF